MSVAPVNPCKLTAPIPHKMAGKMSRPVGEALTLARKSRPKRVAGELFEGFVQPHGSRVDIFHDDAGAARTFEQQLFRAAVAAVIVIWAEYDAKGGACRPCCTPTLVDRLLVSHLQVFANCPAHTRRTGFGINRNCEALIAEGSDNLAKVLRFSRRVN